jgi:hypothetical protein
MITRNVYNQPAKLKVNTIKQEEKERPFYETATPEEWVKAFREWSEGHSRDTPLLSEYALSRSGIYDEDEGEDI